MLGGQGVGGGGVGCAVGGTVGGAVGGAVGFAVGGAVGAVVITMNACGVGVGLGVGVRFEAGTAVAVLAGGAVPLSRHTSDQKLSDGSMPSPIAKNAERKSAPQATRLPGVSCATSLTRLANTSECSLPWP